MNKMRSSVVWFAVLLAAACFAPSLQAASVGPTGYTNAFTTLPAVADWSQYDLAGANSAITTPSAMDAQIQTLTAATVISALVSDSASPPTANGTGDWNSGGFLYTRPTGNAASIIMCTLVNNIGSDAGTVTLSYDLTRVASLVEDDAAFDGHRVYYSLTGLANSWTVIPDFTVSDLAFTSGRLTATLNVAWPSGGNLYVLWADDNSVPSSPDTSLQIDNFFASAISAQQIAESITNQPQSLIVTELAPASFTVGAAGNPRPTYQWFTNNVLLPNATNATYSIANAQLSQNGTHFKVRVSNTADTNGMGAVDYSEVSAPDAILTVLADSTAPTIAQASSTLPITINVTFSEGIRLDTATNLANYSVVNTNTGSPLFLSNAVLSANQSNVVLTTAPQLLGTYYMVTVNGIRDLSAASNQIAANSQFTFLTVSYSGADVGSPAVPSTYTSVGTTGYDIRSVGSDIGGTNTDQFAFESQTVIGDFDLKVRLAGMSLTDDWAKAGLMARSDLTAGSLYTATFATPGISGCFFQYRNAAAANGVNVGGFPVSPPNTWLRLQRVGNNFTGLASYDGVNWATLGSISLALPSQLYVGMAVTSRSTNSVLAQFRDVGSADPTLPLGTVTYSGEPLSACSRKTSLVISEIMYNPTNRADGKNLEFLEVYNSNPYSDDISGYKLAGEIDYTFPAGTIMPGGGFLVLAKVAADVQAVYGITGVLNYGVTTVTTETNAEGSVIMTTNLSNGIGRSGTLQLLNNAGAIYLEIPYSNKNPWPVGADGTGHSLVLNKPSYGEADPRAWGVSDVVGGSPGTYDPIPAGPLRSVKINEIMAHSDVGSGLVDYLELYNYSTLSNDISGCILSDSPATNKFVIPPGTILPPRGYISFTETQLGFSMDASGETLYFRTADGRQMLDVVQYEAQANGIPFGRFPDGASDWYPMTARTPGTTNSGILINDIVINEIMYDPITGNSEDEYVELYNKGNSTVSLSKWKFNQGISFTFPTNTVLASHGYLVVAKSMTNMFAKYNYLNVNNTLGDFGGTLSHKGERLALTMPVLIIKTNSTNNVLLETNKVDVVVDEVTYGTGGRWGEWSAGGGSSLELIDPRSNHRMAYSWADSDETAKAPWTIVDQSSLMDFGANDSGHLATYFEILAQGVGEYLIDDCEARYSAWGSTNLLTPANSSFEGLSASSASSPPLFNVFGSWANRGAQVHTTLETTGGFNGGQCMHLRANDRGDSLANRSLCPLTATPPASASVSMNLKAKVRWLKGWPEVLFRLHGNSAEAVGELTLPLNLGTPGLPNSRAVANGGPDISEVIHTPIVPNGGQAVVVSARVSDPDGLTSVVLNWRLDVQNPSPTYTVAIMNDNGTNGDLIAGDGIYSATIPGQTAGSSVAFYVQATDSLSASTKLPADLHENEFPRECMVRFGDPIAGGSFATYRLWLSANSQNNWTSRPVLSNEDIDGTFVYGNWRVIYNMGGHFAGSPYHQGLTFGNCHYRINMPADDKFLGTTSFNKIHAPGNGPFGDQAVIREQMCYWMARQLGLPWNYRRLVVFYTNGQRQHGTAPTNGLMEDTQVPDGDVLGELFPNDSNGNLYKLQPWFEATDVATGGNSFVNESWCVLNNYVTANGQKKLARYRHNFLTRSANNTVNDYTNVFKLIDACNATNSSAYQANLEAMVDMEEYMRIFAVEKASGNWDSVGNRNEQNMYGYKPTQGKWTLMIWDWNIVLANPATGADTGSDGPDGGRLFPTAGSVNATSPYWNVQVQNNAPAGDPPLGWMYYNPTFLRAYYRALREVAAGPMNSVNCNPIIDDRNNAMIANNAVPLQTAIAAVKTFMATMHNSIVSGLATLNLATNGVSSVPFAVNGPNDYSTSSNLVTLTGTAPVEIKNVFITYNGIVYPTVWTSLTTWTARFAVDQTTNQFAIQGTDRLNNMPTNAVAAVTVEFTGTVIPPQGAVVINEIMYNPTVPNAAYIELYNNTTVAFDLSNWRLEGVDYTFPVGSVIPSRSFVTIAQSASAVAGANYNGSTNTVPVIGEYPGILNTNGQTVSLIKPDGSLTGLVVSKVRYEPTAPWPSGAATGGSALQVIDPSVENSRVGNWSDGTGWKFFSTSGNIGSVSVALGTNVYFYMKAAGEAYIDDVSLVPASGTYAGINVITNGDFEAPLNVGPWIVTPTMTNSSRSTTYAHSGLYSLHVVGTNGGNTSTINVSQHFPSIPTNTLVTLSFWYRTINSTNFIARTFPGSAINAEVSPRAIGFTPNLTNSTIVALPAFPTLWLNELQGTNTTGLTDSFSQHDPWIEIYNSGTNAVTLDTYYLANNYSSNLTQWLFPTGSVINPGSFLVVWADGQPEQSSPNEWHTNFRLDNSTGSVALVRFANGLPQIMDYLSYSGLGPDQSYGDFPDGQPFDRQIFYTTPTPGTNNYAPPVSVLINEWVASNQAGPGGYPDPTDGKYDDWFELYNTDLAHPANIGGYYLTDSSVNPLQWRVPNGTIIPPGGYLLVWADNDINENGTGPFGDLHANFNLNKGGESIGLYALSGTNVIQIDLINFGNQTTDISEGRYPDGASSIFPLTTVTPRGPNSIPTNHPPVLGVIGDSTINFGQTLNVTPSGSDSDAGQTLTYTLSTGPANATIDPNTGVIHWTPTALQAPSTNHFKVKVTDNGVGTLSASITFTVVVIAPSNHAPSLAAIVDKTVYLGRTLSFTASATDPDGGQTLSYSLNAGFPTGASIDATSGLFQWTPSPAQAPGTNQITVTVTDNGLPILTDSKSFNAIVALPPKLGATRSGNTISLSFPSVPGKHYTVQFKNDLNSNSWTDLVTNQAATDTTTTVPDTIVTTPDGRGQRFYRITVLD